MVLWVNHTIISHNKNLSKTSLKPEKMEILKNKPEYQSSYV